MLKNSKDISLFLLPITKDQPSGESIRYDSSYRQLQEMRNKKEDVSIDYLAIEQLCENVLVHTSKDLHVAAILAEAWAHLYGLQGLAQGVELILKLSEVFWETLYPNSKEDPEVRLSAFVWVNEKLSDVSLHVPITSPKIPGFLKYKLADLVDAHQHELNLQKSGLKKHDLIEFAEKYNKPTLAIIYKSMMLTPVKFYQDLLVSVKSCVAILESLEELLEKKFNASAITLKNFDDYLMQIEAYAQEAIAQIQIKPVLSMPEEVQLLHGEELPQAVNVQQMMHDELYDLLVDIANRLEEIDPKSPAPKLIKKAVKWGGMGAADFLRELAQEDISLAELTKILS